MWGLFFVCLKTLFLVEIHSPIFLTSTKNEWENKKNTNIVHILKLLL